MSLSSCTHLLNPVSSNEDARELLTDVGWLIAPPDALIRLVEKRKVWFLRNGAAEAETAVQAQ
eukprot:8569348-Lingulodinium_polyedra.AAC.1